MAFEIPPVTAFLLLSRPDEGLIDGDLVASRLTADWQLDTGISPVQVASPTPRPEPTTAVGAVALMIEDCAVDLFLMQGQLADPTDLAAQCAAGSGWYADQPWDGGHAAYLEVRIAEPDSSDPDEARTRQELGELLTKLVASLLVVSDAATAIHYMPSLNLLDPANFREVATGFLPETLPHPIWLQLRLEEVTPPGSATSFVAGFTVGLAWLGFTELELEPLPAPLDFGAAALRAAASMIMSGDLEQRDGAEFGEDLKFRLQHTSEPMYAGGVAAYVLRPVMEG